MKIVKTLIYFFLLSKNFFNRFDRKYISLYIDFVLFPKREVLKHSYTIVIPTYNSKVKYLKKALKSIEKNKKRIVNPEWIEVVLTDDASKDSKFLDYLEGLKNENPPNLKMIKNTKNLGIGINSHIGVTNATNDFIIVLDHDDELSSNAIVELDKSIHQTDGDFFYSDEDKLKFCFKLEPHFKPNYSPETLLSHNYICHLVCFSRELYKEVGGFRSGFDGSQDYDLFLRMTKQAKKVIHIDKVLYHWRKVSGSTSQSYSEKNYAWENGRKAILDFLINDKNVKDVELGLSPGTYRVRYNVPKRKTVVFLYSDGKIDYIQRSLKSLKENLSSFDFEIVLLCPNKANLIYNFDDKIKYIEYNADSNPPEIKNFAVKQIEKENHYFVFLDAGIELIDHDSILSLIEELSIEGIGIVGGKLLYSNGRIFHSGKIIGLNGVSDNSHRGEKDFGLSYFSKPQTVHNVSAVIGSMMGMKSETYDELEGFDIKLPFYHDVDICLRALNIGKRNLYTPYCSGIYYNIATFEKNQNEANLLEEEKFMKDRHRELFQKGDSYYNSNLTLSGKSYRFKE